jgi:DNA polymerase IV
MKRPRWILHVDMDAFFASVEQRDQPEFRGRPVIVGADPQGGRGRGVVAACSYEARVFGIHSAMPISQAYRRCPHAVYLQGDHRKYTETSRQIFQILERFTPDVEPISIDEAFLDITGSWHLFGSPETVCHRIKTVIQKETGLQASIGLAPNKMTAKIASDLEKPDGLVIVPQDGLGDFLDPLAVEKLWGVGRRAREALARNGIRTIGDLAGWKIEQIVHLFGKNGEHLWKLANGIDPRPVHPLERAKSIGNEFTFEKDVTDVEVIEDTLMRLSEKVSRRLRRAGFRGRTINLKIRFEDFKTHTRAATLDRPTNFADEIYSNAREKARAFPLGERPVRLVGIQAVNLESRPEQPELFPIFRPEEQKKERLHAAMDTIQSRFGDNAIKRRK